MSLINETIPQTYVRLVLAMERHFPGYIDSYYGPVEWRQEAEAGEPRPVEELRTIADQLVTEIASADDMNPQRKGFLTSEIGAIQMHLRMLSGEAVTLAQESQAIFDLTPKWTPESEFDDVHHALDELLPPGDSLFDRREAWEQAGKLQIDEDDPLTDVIVHELRRRTDKLFSLPSYESLVLKYVQDVNWGAYNYYMGKYRSRIEINTDHPVTIPRLVALIAHEGYAGHHTELVLKEQELTNQKGWLEHCLTVLASPSCVIHEGIAVRAQDVLFSDDELAAWFADQLYPQAGLDPSTAWRDLQVAKVTRPLHSVPCNAAIMLLDRKASEEEALKYIKHYGIGRERDAQGLVSMIKKYRSYIFTYTDGGKLLDELFAAKSKISNWFERLLKEPVTPSLIREWIKMG